VKSQTDTVPSESIHTPGLFPHVIVLQPEFENVSNVDFFCQWPTHHMHDVKVELCFSKKFTNQFEKTS
jgi:hypothetical protein